MAASSEALIRARPGLLDLSPAPAPTAPALKRAQRIKLGVESTGRDGLMYVPASYEPTRPSPLLVMLHGASAAGKDCAAVFSPAELEAGRVLTLLPDSRKATSWDVIRGGFGPDVRFLDRALSKVFSEYNVDPHHICCAGFSDGASVAHPPLVFISHGTHDEVLHIDRCSRRIVPTLAGLGLPPQLVLYHEFNGGHSIPASVASRALTWFLR